MLTPPAMLQCAPNKCDFIFVLPTYQELSFTCPPFEQLGVSMYVKMLPLAVFVERENVYFRQILLMYIYIVVLISLFNRIDVVLEDSFAFNFYLNTS